MWKEIITKLIEFGFTQQEIATYSNCSQSYIAALIANRRGKSLSFEIGTKLKEMLNKAETKEILPKKEATENSGSLNPD